MSHPDGLDATSLRRVVVVLSVTQIVSWGVLYYAFPVVAPGIVEDTGWSMTMTTGAFSLSLLAAGLAGIPVGRALDRFGPRPVMTSGSCLGAAALVAVASSTGYAAFMVSWVLTGVATATLLYPPAFAALTRWGGAHRVRAITSLTLVAGFASTVFAPLTALLVESLGWRQTYLVLAGVLLVVTVPGHWWGLDHSWHPDGDESGGGKRPVQQVWRTRPFLALVVAMAAAALCVYAVVINLVPLLTERGFLLRDAAVALGLVGVGQVCGRLGYGALVARTSVGARSSLVFFAIVVTTVVLAVLEGPLLVVLVAATLLGAARGLFTLVQATAVGDRWGSARFGQLNGIVAAPIMLAMAAAPWAGSALAEAVGGYGRAFLVLAGVAGLAVVLTPVTIVRREG